MSGKMNSFAERNMYQVLIKVGNKPYREDSKHVEEGFQVRCDAMSLM